MGRRLLSGAGPWIDDPNANGLLRDIHVAPVLLGGGARLFDDVQRATRIHPALKRVAGMAGEGSIPIYCRRFPAEMSGICWGSAWWPPKGSGARALSSSLHERVNVTCVTPLGEEMASTW